MTVRAVEWKLPYTWWKAITVDENKVISLNLRDENNLIIYDEGDNEIYVDLQLDDELRPTDAFPVWITTGRVIVDNGWDVTWTILVAKTTSWDVIKLLYWDDWKLYIDNGTWTFKQIYLKPEVDALLQEIWTYLDSNLNTKTFFLTGTTWDTNLATAQLAKEWITDGGNAIIMYWKESFHLMWTLPNSICFVSQLVLDEAPWDIFIDQLVFGINTEGTVTSITRNMYNLNNTYVDLSHDQTVGWIKTFSASPIVPSKTTDAANNGTAIATEAQVYKVANMFDDYSFQLASGNTITIQSLWTKFWPMADFEIEAWVVKEGMYYTLRIDTSSTAYTMTLGTGISNPYWESLTLTADKTTTVIMLATSANTLEIMSIKTAN